MAESISLRPAVAADISILLRIMLNAFDAGPDELYEYNFPHRKEFPQDHVYFWNFRMRAALYDPHSLVLIAELEPRAQDEIQETSVDPDIVKDTMNTEGTEVRPSKIAVGWSMWQINADPSLEIVSPEGWKIDDSYEKFFGRCILGLHKSLVNLWYPGRRDTNPAHYQQFFIQGGENNTKYWLSDGEFPQNLMLAGLGVEPEYQGRGFGSHMVRWGLDVAKGQSGIRFVGLETLATGVGFYERFGFEKKGVSAIQVDGEEEKVELVTMVRANVT